MGYGYIPWTFNYLPQKCPCQGCEDRVIGCHGQCKKYKNWQHQKAMAQKAAIQK